MPKKFVATDRPATSQDRQQLLVAAYRHPVPASRGPTLPSTASRITADKQRTGNARRTENPSQPTLSGNRGRAADPTASAMTGGSFQRHGELPKRRKRGATEYRTMRCLARPKAPAIHERRRRRIYGRGGSRLPFRILTFLGSPTNAPDRPALISQASLGCLPRPDRPDRASARRPTASWRRPR